MGYQTLQGVIQPTGSAALWLTSENVAGATATAGRNRAAATAAPATDRPGSGRREREQSRQDRDHRPLLRGDREAEQDRRPPAVALGAVAIAPIASDAVRISSGWPDWSAATVRGLTRQIPARSTWKTGDAPRRRGDPREIEPEQPGGEYAGERGPAVGHELAVPANAANGA